MLSNIELLEKLTKDLPVLDPLAFANIGSNAVSYDVQSGECTAHNLMNVHGIAVADCNISLGTVSARHSHPEKEWFLVYDGSIEVDIDGLETKDIERLMGNGSNFTLDSGDFIFIPQKIPHVVTSPNGAKFIAITIPASQIFPSDD